MMESIAILLFVPLLAFSQIPKDKKYHLGAGIVVGVWGTFAGDAMMWTPETSALFGMGTVALAGMGKELWDQIEYGGWDWKDFGATMIGGVIGVGLSYAGLKIFDHDTQAYVSAYNSYLTVGSFPVILNVGIKIKL